MEDALEFLQEKYSGILLDAIAEAFDAGCRFERQKTGALLADMKNVFDRFGSITEPSQAVDAPNDTVPANAVRTLNYPTSRARPGKIAEHVERVLRKYAGPVKPLKIVTLAQSEGIDLNPSSVRMALRTLRDKGVAVQVGHGEWVLVKLPPGNPEADHHQQNRHFGSTAEGFERMPEISDHDDPSIDPFE